MVQDSSDLAEKALALGFALTKDQTTAVFRYVELLKRWNRVFNLSAIKNSKDIWTHHIFDSMAALAILRKADFEEPSVVDVGSGGGVPGVIWALIRPDWKITCVDAVGKKIAFIQQVVSEIPNLSGNLQGVHARIETHSGQYDVVTSRAFSSLTTFTQCTRHLLKRNSIWFALKGRYPTTEIAELPTSIDVFHVEQVQVPNLFEQRCVVWMRPRTPGITAICSV